MQKEEDADVFLVQILSSVNAILCTMCALCHVDPAVLRKAFFKHALQHSRALAMWIPITTFLLHASFLVLEPCQIQKYLRN